MRKIKLMYNILTSAMYEIISIICGMILPRLILTNYGSNCNGIIVSVTQIISFIALLRCGIGGVTRAAIYKPLADNDSILLSRIVKSTESYMRKVAVVFAIIVVLLALACTVHISEFSGYYTFSLVIILCISTFIQYYFGITYQMVLMADQRHYVYTGFNILSVVLSTALSYLLITKGYTIHSVKFFSAIAFILTPVLINMYVKKHYNIISNVTPENSALSQRWDALGHQLSNYITNSKDIIILTLLSNLSTISVYSVYNFVVKALKLVIKTLSSSIESMFGNMIAKNENSLLKKSFSIFEMLVIVGSNFLFGCALVLILPFVNIYTSGIFDANYIRPDFAFLIILSSFIACLRIPYMVIIEAYGDYKNTKWGAYFELLFNLVFSISLSFFIEPLIAIVIGSLVAMSYRLIDTFFYVDKNLLSRGIKYFYKMILFSIINFSVCCFVFSEFNLFEKISDFGSWIFFAIIISGVIFVFLFFLTLVFYRVEILNFKNLIVKTR